MSGMMRICAALLVGLALLAGVAAAQERAKGWLGVDVKDLTPEEATALGLETPKTLLMLDTGGHMALIKDIAFTPDGRQLVSASDDKTIRVWDPATGKTVRTIRGESAPGHPGKVYTMALSPDGKWLAAGGWFVGERENRDTIRLYDFDSGRLTALLKGHANVVLELAFSPDGRHLISGSGDNTAIIWDVERQELKHRLTGHRDDIYAVGFTPDGQRAVTGSYDHGLRLWRVADGKQIGEAMTGHSDRVRSLAIAPDGAIASGDSSGVIWLWDGKTGAPLRALRAPSTGVGSLSFSQEGRFLLVASGTVAGTDTATIYETTGWTEVSNYSGHDNVVIATALSPDGRWAATGGGANNEIHLWDMRTGERRLGSNGQPLTLGGQGRPAWAVGFSADGQRIGWGNLWAQNNPTTAGPLQHVLTLPSTTDALPRPRPIETKEASSFRRAAASQGEWSLEHRKGGKHGSNAILDIKRNGKLVKPIERGRTEADDHRAYSFTAEGTTIISGGAWGVLSAYDLAGAKLGDFIGHDGEVWAVAPSPDGRYLLSGSHDQTVRLWNLKTRELLVTLFHGADGEWVMWTPEGFFIASENGGKLVGWQINQGPDKEARYVTADQVRTLFGRADLVAAKIAGDPDGKLRKEAARLDIDDILASGPAPEVAIVTPGDGWQASDNTVSVTVRVTDTGGGIGRIAFRVNGQARTGTDDKGGGPGFGAMALNERGERTSSFQLAKPENVIEVTATNGANYVPSLPARVTIKVDERTLKGVPDLYVLAAGVDDYFDSALALKYAVNDSEAIGTALEAAAKSKGGHDFYRNVIVKRLRNAEVTRDTLEAAFIEIGKAARAIDVFVLFVAGHGKTENGVYYFLPPSFRNVGVTPLESQGISDAVWESWTAKIQAEKSLLIYDTCESGTMVDGARKVASRGAEQMTAYEKMKERTGRMQITAAGAADVALEGYRNKHGVLTYALLEAIALGDDNRNGEIDIRELYEYVGARVPELSCELTPPRPGRDKCYKQVPQASQKSTGSSFPLLPRFAAADPNLLLVRGETGAVSPIGQPASRDKTHVVTQETDLLDAPGGKVLRRLTQLRYAVTKVSVENGFALIARDGATIGYVEDSTLAELE